MNSRIYLDNNASTAVHPLVLEAVVKDLQESVGNASSVHFFGQSTRNKITKARRQIAEFLNVKPQELIFTSGGTEGANMLIRGFVEKMQKLGKRHVITSAVEHACVYNMLKHIESQGIEVSYLSPGLMGAVTPDQVENALREDTGLICLMAVNNETGVKTDIEKVAALAERTGIPFIVDAIALLGKEEFSIPKGVSAMIFSGHKIHAPKGIGAVFLRNSIKIPPLLIGGAQENGRRAGSENLAGIVGMGEAVAVLSQDMKECCAEMERLRNRLESLILKKIPHAIVNGEGPRICNTSNISFMGIDGETLLMQLDMEGIAVSHGSACISGALEPSRVLLNMGIPMDRARSAIRFSLSRFTTEQEIDSCVESLGEIILQDRQDRQDI